MFLNFMQKWSQSTMEFKSRFNRAITKKMKNKRCLLFIFLVCSLFINGCSKKQDPLYIELNGNALTFESEGGNQTIMVSSNGEWSVSGETDWCKVSLQSGNRDKTITITALENESYDERKTTLTFRCGTELDMVDVTQSAMSVFEAGYLDVNWDVNSITNYNENTGVVNIQGVGILPKFKKNKVIVLPEKYMYDIRIIESVTISGSSVTLQTKQGNICNLFRNTSFTLSTDPSLSSTSTKGFGEKIYTPSEIGVITEDGYKIIYSNDMPMKSITKAGDEFDIFSFSNNYSGTDLYNNDRHRVFWEKCVFDIGLKGVFSFDFREKVEDKIPWGDLTKFEFYLDGRLNIDLLLKYAFTAQFKDSKETLMKENVLPTISIKFLVGGVPVVIFISTDLYNRYEMDAKAEITMSAGCNIQTGAKMGFNYTKGVGFSPVMSFDRSFALYAPTFTAMGSLLAKGSIYPRINIEIYKCLCPWIEPMPYLKEDFGAGFRTSTDGNNYLGWTSRNYAGLDLRMGIKTDFGMLIPFTDLWTSDIFNPFDVNLTDAPKTIEFVSPENVTKVTAGQAIDVSFNVSSYNNITNKYYPCIGGLVNFDTQGSVNKLFAVSSADGLVSVQWTPKNSNDYLTAKIVDKDGKTISEATFNPVYDDGLTEDIHNIIPAEYVEILRELGLEIYGGKNPPMIEGTYLATPLALVRSNASMGIVEQWDMYVTFSGQDNTTLTVNADYTIQASYGPMSSSGPGSFIVGEGNKFTVFVDAVRTEAGYTAKTVEVFSGEITPNGIKNYQWAVIMINNNGDPLGHWIGNRTGYVKSDSDGFSERVTLTPPVANFTITYQTQNSQACPPPCSATFTNTTNTQGISTTYVWTIDGTQISTSQNTSYTFRSPGSFKVKLTAANSHGSHYVEKTVVIPSSVTISVKDYLALSDGLAYSFSSSNNLKEFYWTSYKTSLLPQNDDDIITYLLSNGVYATPDIIGGYTSGLDEKTSYTICFIPYDTQGQRGALYKTQLSTKSSDDQPEAKINIKSINNGNITFDITKNLYCDKYLLMGWQGFDEEFLYQPDIYWGSLIYFADNKNDFINTQNYTSGTWGNWAANSLCIVITLGYDRNGNVSAVINRQAFSTATNTTRSVSSNTNNFTKSSNHPINQNFYKSLNMLQSHHK